MWTKFASKVVLGAAMAALPVVADAADHMFFKGKSIEVIIGYSAGGTYDATARLLARHMPRYVPGEPTMVPQNMTGAGSLKAIVHLYNVANKDGTAVGMIGRGYPTAPIFFPDKAKYDPAKFNPIGSTSTEVSLAVVWHTTPFRTLADLQDKQVIVGATGLTDDTGRNALLVRNLTGAKIKIVTGYPGGNEVTQAMERGEVDGRFGWSWGSIRNRAKDWLDKKKIRILLQMGLKKASDLPDTPLIMDYARNDLDRQALELVFAPQAMAWPLVAPPGVPPQRLATLRKAFDEVVKDEAFNKEAQKLRIDVEPVSGTEMQEIVERLSKFDRKVIDRALALAMPKK